MCRCGYLITLYTSPQCSSDNVRLFSVIRAASSRRDRLSVYNIFSSASCGEVAEKENHVPESRQKTRMICILYASLNLYADIFPATLRRPNHAANRLAAARPHCHALSALAAAKLFRRSHGGTAVGGVLAVCGGVDNCDDVLLFIVALCALFARPVNQPAERKSVLLVSVLLACGVLVAAFAVCPIVSPHYGAIDFIG